MKLFVLYNKQEYEINLLHDYNENINDNWNEQEKKLYLEGKNNIDGNNIEILLIIKK